jgi:hypothetical protein
MSGTRGGLGRILAMGIGLALVLLLMLGGEARAGFYSVAQCGWGAGADADWWDSTGGAKFRPDGFCAGSPGDHLKSFTREGQGSVTGTRFARWRWVAPPGTGIRQIRGTWWQTLHDGMQQRLGGATGPDGFDPFLTAWATDPTPREFSNTFTPSVPAVEDRLLCARGDDKWCPLDTPSWSGLRGVTLTIDDGVAPGAWITGGDLTDGGWRRGTQFVSFSGYDAGGGVRFGETTLDGGRVGLAEYPCEQALIDGEWRATRMRPCLIETSGTLTIDTTRFSDGSHVLRHCVTDFAANRNCTPERWVAIDNNPPASPRALSLVGGEGWRRVDDFDVVWANPDQGPASPIGGAFWRITGPGGYDTGAQFASYRDLGVLLDRTVPRPGAFFLQVWLRDEAGNASHGTVAGVPLRYDDVPPTVAFVAAEGGGVPEQVQAVASDAHAGPSRGTIFYRRLNVAQWTELPTRLRAEGDAGRATLVAGMPDLQPGTYVFRAEVSDAAGNQATTTLRADGTEMAIRKVPPAVAAQRPAAPAAPKAAPSPRAKTRLFARLSGGDGRGDSLTVPFGAPALVSGRLTRADGAGIAGRELRIVSRPSRGALAPTSSTTVLSGARGGFQARVEPGSSRRIVVEFPGDAGLDPSRRDPLELQVRSGVTLRAAPRSLRTGQTVRFSGSVRTEGAALPRGGKLVAIQFLEAATKRWRPVLVTRTDHRGRFRARYRFRYVSGTASIRLRALALAGQPWPYAPGFSRPLTVRVQGR